MSEPAIQFWVSQPVEPLTIDTTEMKVRADVFARRLHRRDAIEYAAGGAVVVAFGSIGFLFSDTFFRIACGTIILGTLMVMRNLWMRRVKSSPQALAQASHVYYRDELVRQRDSLASVWQWYLAPFVPGVAMFLLAIWRLAAQTLGPVEAITGLLPAAFSISGMFIAIHWLNRIAARRLTREITALELEIEPSYFSIRGN